jgi:hypothetical protein
MKASRKIKFLLLVALLAMAATSCIRLAAENRLTVDKGAIPPDFGRTKGTLLVLTTGAHSYDGLLKRNFTAYWDRYALVTADQLAVAPYTDFKAYPYVLGAEIEQHASKGNDGKDHILNLRRFYILDRTANQRFVARYVSGFYAKVLKGYIANLNKELLAGATQ